MLATLIEVVDAGQRTYIARHLKRGKRLPEPLRVPRPKRPWEPEPEPEPEPKSQRAKIREFFAGMTGS